MCAKIKKAQQTGGPYWSRNAQKAVVMLKSTGSGPTDSERRGRGRRRSNRRRRGRIKPCRSTPNFRMEKTWQSPLIRALALSLRTVSTQIHIWICRLIRWMYYDIISKLLIYRSASTNWQFQLLIDKVLSVGHHFHFKDNKKAHGIHTENPTAVIWHCVHTPVAPPSLV